MPRSVMMTKAYAKVGRNQRLVLVVAILASFIAFLDGSVVGVALPAITAELGGGLALQQWVVDAYLITLGSFILLAGSLSDSFGRLRILKVGLCAFGVASLLCAAAPTAEILVVARLLQGGAAALLVPSSLAIILSAFSGEGRGRAIGVWTAWTGAAGLAGPLVGGVLVDSLSWRLVFAINLLPIVATLVLIKRLDQGETSAARGLQKIDLVGAALGAVGLAGPVVALIEGQRRAWVDPLLLIPLVLGLVSLGTFLWWERRHANPMMPLDLFRIRNFGMGNVATAFIYGAVSLGFFAITVYVQQIGAFSATAAGLATLPSTVVVLALSSTFGRLSGKYGPRVFMTVGPLLAGAGFFVTTSVGSNVEYWLQLFPGILLIGLGLAVTAAPLTSGILGSISAAHAGIGSAVNSSVARVAGLVTTASIGIIAGGSLADGGYIRVMIVTSMLMLTGAAVSWVGMRKTAAPS